MAATTGRRSRSVRILVDTSALLAISRTRDQYHETALRIAQRHLGSGGRFVGTTLVLGELHSHLLYLRGPELAREALIRLLEDAAHECVDVTAEIVRGAIDSWLMRFGDRRFSLVDAVSFEVMRRRRITHAFAFDQHFETAGFSTLR